MRIVDHVIEGVEYVQAHPSNHGGRITPKFLVMHFTAGWQDQHAIDIFASSSGRVSAHLILDRDGTLTQMLPFDVKGYHAGESYWRGYNGLNGHSIGIEIVNYGSTPHFREDTNTVMDRRGTKPVGSPDEWLYAPHQIFGGRSVYWQRYTQEQLDVLDVLTPLLIQEYNLREVVGHDEIATPKGRKPDPGPAFPMAFYKEFTDFANSDSAGRYIVIGTNSLNCRGGPGTNYDIIRTFTKGDAFKAIKFEGSWALIEWQNQRGWVHESYIMRA